MTAMAFGASGLERAALLRNRSDDLAEAQKRPGAVLPFWRGKIAANEDGDLLWLPGDHPIFAEATEAAVFLGDDGGVLRFARDISAWEPLVTAETLGAFFDPSVQVHPDAPDDFGFRELRAIMTRLSVRDGELAAIARSILAWHKSHRFCAACGGPSQIEEAGWQRLCPDCGTRHFPRTDPVVIMLVTHGNDLLLGRSPGWPDGMYSLLAGFVEPGETLEAAAAREVFEESGIRLGPVSYAACQPWPFPSTLMIGMIAEAESRKITLDPAELEHALWLPKEQVLDALAGEHETVKPARKGAIARQLIEEWLAGRIG